LYQLVPNLGQAGFEFGLNYVFLAAKFGQSVAMQASGSVKTNQANCLLGEVVLVSRCSVLLETRKVSSMQLFCIFEHMILGNMLDVIMLVNIDTRFYEK
jgi:hypothetical protein